MVDEVFENAWVPKSNPLEGKSLGDTNRGKVVVETSMHNENNLESSNTLLCPTKSDDLWRLRISIIGFRLC